MKPYEKLTEAQFEEAKRYSPGMEEKNLARARAILVDGRSCYKTAEQTGCNPSNAYTVARRFYQRYYRKLVAHPGVRYSRITTRPQASASRA